MDKFVVFAKEWWDVNGPTKPLHLLNHVRVPFAREQILTSSGITEEAIAAGKSLEGFKIIDVGCGAGIFSEVNKVSLK